MTDGIEMCPGCAAALPPVDGPAHPYMTCSPSCWQRYGKLLAAQYQDPSRMSFHQVIVDTYAVQHPDGDDTRAIQSVGIHLMTLCLFLERRTDPALGTRLHRLMVERPVFHWLQPPPMRGQLTVLDVPTQGEAATVRDAAFAWATETWSAWAEHHPTVRHWLDKSGFSSPS